MSTEVAIYQPPTALANRAMFEEVTEAIMTNVGGTITEFDLPKIKLAKDAMGFTVPTLEGTELHKEIEGVIVYRQNVRSYWKAAFGSSAAAPPDCYSLDGVTGKGTPGGDCANCPFAQFGSDPKGGRGQACKSYMRVLIMRGENALPELVQIPPTSLSGMKRFLVQLAGKSTPYYAVGIKLTIQEQRDGGNVYGEVVPKLVGRLKPEQVALAVEHNKLWSTQFGATIPADYTAE